MLKNKKVIISLVVIFVLIIGVGVGVYLVQQRQELRTKAEPATTLQLVSDNSAPEVDEIFSVDVDISTNENEIYIAQLEIKFDPDTLEALEVTPGSFFTNPEITGPVINNDNGTVFYELKLPLGLDPQGGNGTIVTLTFSAETLGITVIDFGSNTVVGASQEDVNVIAALIPATIDIQSSLVTTPTPTPTPSPTPENGDAGTLTPTPTPTDGGLGGGTDPTITPTPTITATPSATPSPTPSTLPDTATITPTYILAGLGMILMLSAALLLAL